MERILDGATHIGIIVSENEHYPQGEIVSLRKSTFERGVWTVCDRIGVIRRMYKRHFVVIGKFKLFV